MIPRTVRVGPYRYKVVDRHGSENLGECEVDKLRIHVQVGQPPDSERDTLLHELLHACIAHSGLDRRLADDVEEDVVRSLSPILLDTLRRNKNLIAYLTGET